MEDDVSTTLATATSSTPGLFSNDDHLSLEETHTPRGFRDITDRESELAMQPLQIFEREKISMSTKVKDEVRAIANKHNVQTPALFWSRNGVRDG